MNKFQIVQMIVGGLIALIAILALVWADRHRMFRLEEIDGDGRCPTYLFRWTLLSTPWFKIYLHRFVADDWSKDLHDHPKKFVTIGLRGSYLEVTPDHARQWRAPWIRSFPAEHI